jgi:outer membrane protein assembly factor BamD (BamD/ComL family)
LEKAMLINDLQRRSQVLEELAEQYPKRDAGIRAHYERGIAKIKLWKKLEGSAEENQKLLADARRILTDFIENYPDNPFSEQAAEKLQTLPQPE